MYGNFGIVDMRNNKSRKQIHLNRRALVASIVSKLQHGDFRIIERRLKDKMVKKRRKDGVKQGVSYNSIRYTLKPEHPLFCKCVVEEAILLIGERESQACQDVNN